MPYLTHPSGVKTFYRDDDFTDPWTPSATILIQHGFGRSSAFWYHWVPVLARKYRVIRRDALGHGYTSGAPVGYPRTVDSFLDDLVDTLDQLKLAKVHLLGKSTAGILSNFFGAKHPDRMHSVTICGSPLVLTAEAQKTLAFGYPTPVESIRGLGACGWGKAFADLATTGKDAPNGFMAWWLEQFSIPTAEGLCDYAEIVCSKEANVHLVIDQIHVPLLLLTPAHSALVPMEDQEKLANTVKGRHMDVIPGAGHEIYLDQAELCQRKYLEFLARVKKGHQF